MDFIFWGNKPKHKHNKKEKKEKKEKNKNDGNDLKDGIDGINLNDTNDTNDTKDTHNVVHENKIVNQIIIRHFKTQNNKIDYKNSYEEAKPYILFIKKYVEQNNIKEIDIYTSPQERTLITSLVIHMYLRDLKNIVIHKPRINEHLNRDPLKRKIDSLLQYFSSHIKTNENKLTINVTHSSVYSTIFVGLLCGTNNECSHKYDSMYVKKKIHEHSLSWIKSNTNKNDFDFNMRME